MPSQEEEQAFIWGRSPEQYVNKLTIIFVDIYVYLD
jgi:hypothetical protein